MERKTGGAATATPDLVQIARRKLVALGIQVEVADEGRLLTGRIPDDGPVIVNPLSGEPLSDIRFYVEYAPGSFDALKSWETHSWKRTPKLKEVKVEYERPTRTLYNEER